VQLAASGALAAFATWRNAAALRALCSSANLQVRAASQGSSALRSRHLAHLHRRYLAAGCAVGLLVRGVAGT
jgi:hypothetical protein